MHFLNIFYRKSKMFLGIFTIILFISGIIAIVAGSELLQFAFNLENQTPSNYFQNYCGYLKFLTICQIIFGSCSIIISIVNLYFFIRKINKKILNMTTCFIFIFLTLLFSIPMLYYMILEQTYSILSLSRCILFLISLAIFFASSVIKNAKDVIIKISLALVSLLIMIVSLFIYIIETNSYLSAGSNPYVIQLLLEIILIVLILSFIPLSFYLYTFKKIYEYIPKVNKNEVSNNKLNIDQEDINVPTLNNSKVNININMSVDESINTIARLKTLLDSGAITKEEYEEKRKKYLDNI